MSLQLPSENHPKLKELTVQYNNLGDSHQINKLFLLQKIHFELNTVKFDENLFNWFHQTGEASWSDHLKY